tara:strand:- start:337 stop:492 length:156 start_codon:yes stop_codon:yes gene_type:complete
MLEVVLVVTVLMELVRYHYKVLTFMDLDKTPLVVHQVEEELVFLILVLLDL